MKIESSHTSPLGQPAVRSQKPASSSSTPTVEDSAEVRLAATADPGTPVDAGKVADIRKAISEGRLQIDAERIADRLIEATRENLAREGRS